MSLLSLGHKNDMTIFQLPYLDFGFWQSKQKSITTFSIRKKKFISSCFRRFVNIYLLTMYFQYNFRYSFAIVGINLTHLAYRLLTDGCAKTHIFNVCATSHMENERKPILKHFHHLYSYLFVEFDKFWLAEKPRDVMEFNRIRDLFENQIRTMLADRNCHFKINITVENV